MTTHLLTLSTLRPPPEFGDQYVDPVSDRPTRPARTPRCAALVAVTVCGLVTALALTACSSAGSRAGSPGASSTPTSSVVPPNVLLGIAAAEKACMNLGDALTAQQSGGAPSDVAASLTAAAGAARAASEQDLRWRAFANDVGAIANGAASQDGTTRVGGVCAHLSQDASVYTTSAPYPSAP
jgi:hypothetical protein